MISLPAYNSFATPFVSGEVCNIIQKYKTTDINIILEQLACEDNYKKRDEAVGVISKKELSVPVIYVEKNNDLQQKLHRCLLNDYYHSLMVLFDSSTLMASEIKCELDKLQMKRSNLLIQIDKKYNPEIIVSNVKDGPSDVTITNIESDKVKICIENIDKDELVVDSKKYKRIYKFIKKKIS